MSSILWRSVKTGNQKKMRNKNKNFLQEKAVEATKQKLKK
jgi:hypothetical protein